MEDLPLVSIICTTYNHEKYISEAIEGFLMQETSFPFEIIVHDDASTDRTIAIVKSYEEKHPNLIKPIYQSINQFSLGKRIIPSVIPFCKGKYIALCEGDDYWIDPSKLQKQINFLETNPAFSICFHRVYELRERRAKELAKLNKSDKEEIYTIEDLAKGNLIHTPSAVFRNSFSNRGLPSWIDESPVGDYVLHMLNARQGKIKYFPEPMAIYRIHSGGVWSSQTRLKVLGNWIKVLSLLLQEFKDHAEVHEQLLKQLIRIIWESFNLEGRNPINVNTYDSLTKDDLKDIIDELLFKASNAQDQHLKSIHETKASKEYRIGSLILRPLRFLKKHL